MFYIEESVTVEVIIEKSRFIGNLIPVDSIESINSKLSSLKKIHKEANHQAHAYVIREGKEVKANDDGEPSRTAGFPILEVLKAHQLTDVICVVTRYFGGIKLGAPGLTRAYRETAIEAVMKATCIEKTYLPLVELNLRYDQYDTLQYQMNSLWIVKDVQFADTIRITAVLKEITPTQLRLLYHDIQITDLGMILSALK